MRRSFLSSQCGEEVNELGRFIDKVGYREFEFLQCAAKALESRWVVERAEVENGGSPEVRPLIILVMASMTSPRAGAVFPK